MYIGKVFLALFVNFTALAMKTFIIDAELHQKFLKENRKDPVTADFFRAGDEVVFCKACSSSFLLSSWQYMGAKHCGQSEILSEFPDALPMNLTVKYDVLHVFRASFWENIFLPSLFLLIALLSAAGAILASSVYPAIFGVFFALMSSWLFDFSHWEIQTRGILKRANLYEKLFSENFKQKFIAESNVKAVLVVLTDDDGHNNSRRAEYLAITHDEKIYKLGREYFAAYDLSDLKKMAQIASKIAEKYALVFLSSKWYEGFLVGFYATDAARKHLTVNDYSWLEKLSKAKYPTATVFLPESKLYFTSRPIFSNTGFLIPAALVKNLSVNLITDECTVTERGILWGNAKKFIPVEELNTVKFTLIADGFEVIAELKNQQKSENFRFTSVMNGAEVAKSAAYGFAVFAKKHGIAFECNIPSSFGIFRSFWDEAKKKIAEE